MRVVVVFLIIVLVCAPVAAQDDGVPPPLTIREPTPEQLGVYLQAYVRLEKGYDLRIVWHDTPIQYADVNGDGEDDLIADGRSYVAVLLWLGDAYSEPFQQLRLSGRIHQSRLTLRDVTNDGVPEVIFDHITSYTGTDLGGMRHGRDVIHCSAEGCTIVWQGELFDEFHSHFPSVKLTRMDVEFNVIDSVPQIIATWRGFTIYCGEYYGGCILAHARPDLVDEKWLPVETRIDFENPVRYVTELRYEWTGTTFEIVASNHTEESFDQSAFAVYEATNDNGVRATLRDRTDDLTSAPFSIEIQDLYLNNQNTGIRHVSFPAFSKLEWRDMTGDGVDELVWHLTAGTMYEAWETKPCPHQRVLVYQLVDGDLIPVADVMGCVRDADLFGVRLDDVDDDGQLEIVSAGDEFYDWGGCLPYRDVGCWPEISEAIVTYEWDGAQFVPAVSD